MNSTGSLVINEDVRSGVIRTLGKFNLIFADPPFNIGVQYDSWDDNLDQEEYSDFTALWIKDCIFALAPGGRLCIHVPDKVVPVVLSHIPKWLPLDEWIIWHYRFGVYTPDRFVPSKCHCLVFKDKSAPSKWNPPLVPSDRATKYNDPRSPRGTRPPFDIWGLPEDGHYWGRVTGNSAERQDVPNQLPEVYLKRIIESYTDPGDRVLDPFCGSGTTFTVATSLGRDCVTIDRSKKCCNIAMERALKGMVRR